MSDHQQGPDAPAPERPRGERRRPFVRGLGALVAVVAVVTTVLVSRAGDDTGSRPPPATRPGAEAAESTRPDRAPAASAPDGASALAFRPQPERRFVRVGTTNREQFTDEHLRFLADNFGVVLFTKFHGGFDIRLHHEAARRLVALRPGIEVYPYFSTKYWFDQNRWDGAEIDPAWLLRDNEGNLVQRFKKRDGEKRPVSAYVDLANPAYRAWALEVLASWLESAPYAGISFDGADPIGDFGREKELERWSTLLGERRIAAYNAGLRALLAAADRLAGPDRKVVYNGISPSPLRGPDRDLDLLTVTDGALNEGFCLGPREVVQAVEEDISLLSTEREKHFYMRTNYRPSFDQTQRERFERYCLGAFLMGWQPGRSYFQIGADYSAEQLGERNLQIDVNLGNPAAPYEHHGTLAQRDFDNGVVYLNMGSKPAQVTLSQALTEVRSGKLLDAYGAGDSISVPANDAVYLLRTSFLARASGE